MSTRRPTSPTPPTPVAYAPPVREGGLLAFTSRAQLVTWHDALHDPPRPLREISPRHVGDVSAALATLAADPDGGTLYMPTPPRSPALRWLDEACMEHGPGAIDGPHPMRLEDQPGVVVGVTPGAPPSFWDELEPDAWPLPQAEDRYDDRRVACLVRSQPFAAPVGVLERDHQDQTLLGFKARRWFRGQLVPTIAGLVAFSDRPEKYLPGCAIALRQPGAQDQVLTGSLPWLAERVSGERYLWGAIPREIKRTLVVLALAERAWVGPDAATPITLSRERGRVRLAIPTAPANARERLDRAPGNPHVRQLLLRLGELPRIEGDDLPDNDAVLRWVNARHPGARCRYARAGTWFEIPVEPEVHRATVVEVRSPSAAALPGPASADPPAHFAPAPPEPDSEAPLEAPALAAVPPAAFAPVPYVASAPTVAPISAPPRPPRRPGPPPVFHPRPAAAPAPSVAPSPAPPPPDPAPAPTPHPAPEPPPPPPVSALSGPMTLDERKAQLRAVFLQTDRPLSTREIAEILGVHRDTPLAAMKALVAEGWLVPTDPNPRSPVQRYRRVGG